MIRIRWIYVAWLTWVIFFSIVHIFKLRSKAKSMSISIVISPNPQYFIHFLQHCKWIFLTHFFFMINHSSSLLRHKSYLHRHYIKHDMQLKAVVHRPHLRHKISLFTHSPFSFPFYGALTDKSIFLYETVHFTPSEGMTWALWMYLAAISS